MVKTVKTRLTLFAMLALSLSGCGLVSRWWGEEAPDREIVRMKEGPACPELMTVLDGDDAESARTIDCWDGKIGQLWVDVEGKSRDRLTEKELRTLFDRDIIAFTGEKRENIQKVEVIKRLLGVDHGISKAEITSWLEWLRENRREIRRNRRVLSLWLDDGYSTGRNYLSYEDVRSITKLTSAFLRRLPWEMRSRELLENLRPFWGREFKRLDDSLDEIADVLIDSAGVICPRVGERRRWDPQMVAHCIDIGLTYLEKGAPWFESLLNPYSPRAPRPDRVARSLDEVAPYVQQWVAQRELRPATTRLWVQMGRSLGLEMDDNSLSSIDWIQDFNSQSNSSKIHPSILLTAFEIIRETEKAVIASLPNFSHCNFTRPEDWERCQIRRSGNDPNVNLALRVRHDSYGGRARPLGRNLFRKIMLFNVVSQRIIDAYDKKWGSRGILSIESVNEPEELTRILELAFQFQKNSELFEDLSQSLRLKGYVPPPGREPFLKKYNPGRIRRLVTLMGDVLVRPKIEEEKAFEDLRQLFKNLRTGSKESALFLDRTSLTAVITTFDSLSSFRNAYIEMDENHLGIPLVVATTMAGTALVTRKSLLDALPRLLREFFPRLHQSCQRFGYDKSCKVVFEQIVPGHQDADLIYASDIDVVTLIAIYAESLMDYCDRDGNGLLEGGGFRKGDDELDCTFNKLKTTAVRLMDAGIVPEDPSARKLLKFADSFFLTRAFAKAAMDRGDKDHLWKSIFKLWHQKADLGSIMGLAADVIGGNVDPSRDSRNHRK